MFLGPTGSEAEHVFPMGTHTHNSYIYMYMHICICAWPATQINSRNTALTQIPAAPTTSSSCSLWLTRIKACYRKIYIHIYINIYTHSLDSPVPGLRHPVYPLTSPGCPDLPAASPTGRHPHARRGLSGSWSKEWHRRTLTGVLQGFVEEALCPRTLAACCSSELMVWAWLFPSSWD